MAAKKFLRQISGGIQEVLGIQTSAGAGNAGDLVSLDDNGRLDTSLLPTGVGADTASVTASEALAAGDLVNVWSSSGAFRVRKADATSSGKPAHGFVLAAVSSSATATVYFAGRDTQVSGLTPGDQYLSTTAGVSSATPPSGSGNVVQLVGTAVAAAELNFEAHQPIVLA